MTLSVAAQCAGSEAECGTTVATEIRAVAVLVRLACTVAADRAGVFGVRARVTRGSGVQRQARTTARDKQHQSKAVDTHGASIVRSPPARKPDDESCVRSRTWPRITSVEQFHERIVSVQQPAIQRSLQELISAFHQVVLRHEIGKIWRRSQIDEERAHHRVGIRGRYERDHPRGDGVSQTAREVRRLGN